MPLFKIDRMAPSRCWALWHITESESELAARIAPHEHIPGTLSFPQKRLEFAAGRLLVKAILAQLNSPFEGIVKDEHGKPRLTGSLFKISLSHSYPYVAALIDANSEAGIDIEQPKSKLLRVGPRILHAEELTDAGTNITKHCVYWCAKESLMKVYGKRNLAFSENLRIKPFKLESEGLLFGKVIADISMDITLQYRIFPDFVLVYSCGENR